MKEILFIVGSLRESGFNRQLAGLASATMHGKAKVTYLEFSDIPYMNQDIEFPTPPEISAIREKVLNSDGVWIFTPEYNYSYPGVLKNLLDWLSRPLKDDGSRISAMTGKKVTVSSVAGKSAGSGAREKLNELMEVIRSDVMKEPQVGVTITEEAFSTGLFMFSFEHMDAVKQQADSFLRFLEQ